MCQVLLAQLLLTLLEFDQQQHVVGPAVASQHPVDPAQKRCNISQDIGFPRAGHQNNPVCICLMSYAHSCMARQLNEAKNGDLYEQQQQMWHKLSVCTQMLSVQCAIRHTCSETWTLPSKMS